MDFLVVAEYFGKIEAASSRLDMSATLSELFSKTPQRDIDKVVYLCQGSLGANFDAAQIGMGEKLIAEAISKVSGHSREDIDRQFKKIGDLGNVAEKVISTKSQQSLFREKLSIDKVYANLMKVATVSGTGSQEMKLKLMAELFNSASPIESRYIARIPLGNLRLGIGDPTIMDAFAITLLPDLKKNKKLVSEFEKNLKEKKEDKRAEELERKMKLHLREKIEAAYNIHSDLGYLAKILKEKGISGMDKIEISSGIPIRPTLAERLPSAEEIIEKLGKCAVEAKYDGFRLQVHKNSEKVEIFSRNMENMTEMFPDIVAAVREQISAKRAVFEGEALAVNELTGEFFPFQITMQRKRKYDIGKKAEEFPLKLFCFDIMYADGKNLMQLPFKERRKELVKIIKKGTTIELTESIITADPKMVESFFEDAVSRGLEGIIAKDLDAPYIAGARKFAWIKLKRSYKGELSDSVDAVIIGYFKGKGHRTQFGLGALLTAVYDSKDDRFESIAKIGTGMTEEMLSVLEEKLSKIKSAKKPARVDSTIEPDVWCEPKYVIEVRADEITKSPLHTAGKEHGEGYALRFPRLIKERPEKKAEQATSVKEVISLYNSQKRLQIQEG